MSNKNTISNLPSPVSGGLSIYLSQIKKISDVRRRGGIYVKKLERKWKFAICT